MNIIESIIVEDGIRGLNLFADDEKQIGMLENARTGIIKVYNSSSKPMVSDDSEFDMDYVIDPLRPFNPNIPNYIEPTESGYPGLEPPVG